MLLGFDEPLSEVTRRAFDRLWRALFKRGGPIVVNCAANRALGMPKPLEEGLDPFYRRC